MSPDPAPPRWTEALLRRSLGTGIRADSILGDLREEHARRARGAGAAANRWYLREALGVAARALRDRARARTRGAPMAGRERPTDGTGRTTYGGGKDPMLSQISRDLKHAVRSLARAPRFTLVVVFTLALGIGANTAIFSVVNGILLSPLPHPDADELVNVWSTAPGVGYDQFPLSPDVYFFYEGQSTAFQEMALRQQQTSNLTDVGEPERIEGTRASHTLFDVLRETPALGRTWTADEDLPEAPAVVVLGHGLWERRFAGDPAVVGRTVRLDGVVREVIGVMPEGFEHPRGSEFWIPLGMDPADPIEGQFAWQAIARLAPGVGPDDAQAQLEPVVARFAEQVRRVADGETYAAFLGNGRYAAMVRSMKEDLVGPLEQPLWILLGTVAMVLLIACANVANLVMIRAEGRRRETAVRVAMGASRGSLARHHLAESAVLAGAGALVGLVVAAVGVPMALRWAPPELPRLDEVGVDARVLLFTLALTAVATALFGLAPMARARGAGLLGALRQGGRGSTGSARQRGRKLLVTLQTSLALVLLVGSGLLVRTFQKTLATDLGIETEDRLTFRIFLAESRYATPTEVTAFHEQLEERLAALPGVRSVGLVSNLPIAEDASGTAHAVEDQPTAPGELPPMIHYVYAGPTYLETMGTPLVRGRTLTEADHRDGNPVVVVSRTVAESLWPDGEALGRRIRPAGDTVNWFEVVGVVEPVLADGVRETPRPLVYYPMLSPAGDDGWSLRGAAYVIEAEEPETLAQAVRETVWSLDADLPLANVSTMDEIVARSVVELSFTMFTLGVAALLAMLLGAVGLYGVLSYSVAQRTQEIGVRMALGARTNEVLKMVVRDGAKTQLVGLAVGLIGAAALTRLLQGMLYGVEPLDPVTFAGGTALLLVVGLAAAWLPARRAASVDPTESMRAE